MQEIKVRFKLLTSPHWTSKRQQQAPAGQRSFATKH
jgi:hypothetical protein